MKIKIRKIKHLCDLCDKLCVPLRLEIIVAAKSAKKIAKVTKVKPLDSNLIHLLIRIVKKIL